MNQNEYKKNEYEESDLKQDLWNEYLNELPDNEEQKEQKETVRKPQLSSKVEQDLMDYSRRRFSRRSSNKSGRNALVVAFGIIMAVTIAIGAAVSGFMYISDRGEDYPDYPQEYIQEEYQDTVLGGDLGNPQFMLDDYMIELPAQFSDFMQEDWKVSWNAFTESTDEVGSDPVALVITNRYGNKVCDVMVVSPTGEPVPLSDATVIAVSVESESNTWLQLPGDVYSWSSTYSIEEALNQSNVEWVKKGDGASAVYEIRSKNMADSEYDYIIRIEMTDGSTQRISLIMEKKA